MAGDWIKIEDSTPSKPEIDVLAELLGLSVNEVLGALVRLWIWADQQTVDGNAASVTKCAIDRHTSVTGFADALLSDRVRWLEISDIGGFSFPNFERHNGQSAKRRALTAKRVAAAKKRKGNAAVTLGALPREEKRREEKSIKKPPISPCSETFERWWKAYPAEGRVAKRKAAGAWRRHVANELIPVVMAATAEYAACGKVRAGYVRQATTWLNGRAWEDDRAAWESCAAADGINSAKQTRESVEEIVRRASNAAR